MIQKCMIHGEVTTWGCRQCLRDKLRKVCDESIERLKTELEQALAPEKAKHDRRSDQAHG